MKYKIYIVTNGQFNLQVRMIKKQFERKQRIENENKNERYTVKKAAMSDQIILLQ